MTTAYDLGNVPPIEVRHRLRIAREFAGLEQIELAEKIGVSRNTIGNMEKGHTTPRKIVLNAWALATGVPVGWLENGETPAGPGDGPDGGSENGTGGGSEPKQTSRLGCTITSMRQPNNDSLPLKRVS